MQKSFSNSRPIEIFMKKVSFKERKKEAWSKDKDNMFCRIAISNMAVCQCQAKYRLFSSFNLRWKTFEGYHFVERTFFQHFSFSYSISSKTTIIKKLCKSKFLQRPKSDFKDNFKCQELSELKKFYFTYFMLQKFNKLC